MTYEASGTYIRDLDKAKQTQVDIPGYSWIEGEAMENIHVSQFDFLIYSFWPVLT